MEQTNFLLRSFYHFDACNPRCLGGASSGKAAAWAAITRVWASKWNARAFSALAAAGAQPAALQMAVLIQGVLPAAYSWVAHTTHPVTGAALPLRT